MLADLPGWLQVALSAASLVLQALLLAPPRPRRFRRARRFRLRCGKFELSRSDVTDDQS